MPTAAFPASLQQYVNSDSFSYQFGETTIRSNMDIGPAKIRRRTTRPIDTLSGTILLSVSQFTVFETFFNTTINGGANRFTLPHPITGVVSEFRFTKPPSVRNVGPIVFSLSMEWEKL